MTDDRYKFFQERGGNRYWWFHGYREYTPDIISLLSEEEWEHLKAWYEETDEKRMVGECNIPMMTELLAYINGSGIDNVVQLGHYSGWSTLFLGWAMRRMKHRASVWSVDINHAITEFTNKWIMTAGLSEYVLAITADSTDSANPGLALEYLGKMQLGLSLVFVDSSHQYAQTIEEIELWFPHLAANGMMIFHDAGEFAKQYDTTEQGGVHKALRDWHSDNQDQATLSILNEFDTPYAPVRQDKTGIGILQKVIRE